MNSLVYLDYCATTPLHPEVLDAMTPVLNDHFGNPSSLHWAGRKAKEIMENARGQVATSLGCNSDEVVFTSGATEADNLVIFGTMRQYPTGNAHMITCQTEHHAILHAARQVEKEGYPVTYLPVNNDGLISLEKLQATIRAETKLISIMLVNNETGVIQPIRQISDIAHQHNVLLHTDAVQGMGIPGCQIEQLQVDMLSLSAHKIYGPKGIGALFISKNVIMVPTSFGGPQELNIRAGTENLPGIVGLAAAVAHIRNNALKNQNHLSGLRKRLIKGLRSIHSDVIINGSKEQTAHHVISAAFPHASGEMLLLKLDRLGFAVSLGSACTSKDFVPSHVLQAMGLQPHIIEGTLRISIGEPTTEEEIDRLLETLRDIIPETLFS
jgi:cysteine desulfurase